MDRTLLIYGSSFAAGMLWGMVNLGGPAVAFVLGITIASGDYMPFVLLVVGYLVGTFISSRRRQ